MVYINVHKRILKKLIETGLENTLIKWNFVVVVIIR